MNYTTAICAGLTALGIAMAGSTLTRPALAQGLYIPPPQIHIRPMMRDVMPPGEVLMAVRAAGLSPLTRPALRGSRYLLLASDQMGGQLRVVVNAFDGRIMRVMPAHDPRFAHHPPRPYETVPAPSARRGAPPPPRQSAGPTERRQASQGYTPRNPMPRGAIVRTQKTPDSQLASAPPESNPAPKRSRARPAPAPDASLASAPPATDPTPQRPARTPLPPRRPAPKQTAAAPAESPAAAPAETVAVPTETARPQPAVPAAAPPTPAKKDAPARSETVLVPVAPLD